MVALHLHAVTMLGMTTREHFNEALHYIKGPDASEVDSRTITDYADQLEEDLRLMEIQYLEADIALTEEVCDAHGQQRVPIMKARLKELQG